MVGRVKISCTSKFNKEINTEMELTLARRYDWCGLCTNIVGLDVYFTCTSIVLSAPFTGSLHITSTQYHCYLSKNIKDFFKLFNVKNYVLAALPRLRKKALCTGQSLSNSSWNVKILWWNEVSLILNNEFTLMKHLNTHIFANAC